MTSDALAPPVPVAPGPVPPALAEVRRRIAEAAARSGRDPAEITLTAVSKQQPPSAVTPVLAAGQRVFGENRVQEAQGRWAALKAERGAALELRLIGPLQTNKARDAVALFDAVETLDRPRLAEALAEAMGREGRTPQLLVQVNTGEERQKAGVPPREAEAFVRSCREAHGLAVSGLMCIPPAEEPPGPHFALLARLAADCGVGLLSMGMSADFETAIRFGATHVRVGSLLFGHR